MSPVSPTVLSVSAHQRSSPDFVSLKVPRLSGEEESDWRTYSVCGSRSISPVSSTTHYTLSTAVVKSLRFHHLIPVDDLVNSLLRYAELGRYFLVACAFLFHLLHGVFTDSRRLCN